jgi:hypothetical protein
LILGKYHQERERLRERQTDRQTGLKEIANLPIESCLLEEQILIFCSPNKLDF